MTPTRPRPLVEALERRELLSVVPSGFSETRFVGGLARPTAMAFAPDGRLFVCEQGGSLRVVKNGQLLPTPFLQVPADSRGERGLLGVTFDPNFAANGHVYVYYTATDTPEIHNRVSRFTASGDVASAGSERVVMDLPTLRSATNHNGGALHFGRDGKLYIAVGENALASNSQSLDTPLGKMLRINADGSIPADNPFFGSTTGINRAIWALGLRNPFTFAFQPGTGRMFINDVGQSTFEEVNEGSAGANYGWPASEGNMNVGGFAAPLHTYGRGVGGAITGGTFYNPATPNFPSSYTGDYFYADYIGNVVRSLDLSTRQASPFASVDRPVDLRVGPDGSMYALLHPENAGGSVTRFAFAASDAPSIASPPADRRVSAGQAATFSVTAAGSLPLTYQWQRNGQDIPGATSASYTLPAAAAADSGATFRVVVSNGSGSVTSNPATLTVVTGQAPTASIDAPAAGSVYRAGQPINFSGTATDPEDGPLGAPAFQWRVDFFHHPDTPESHAHPTVAPFGGATSGAFTAEPQGHTDADVFYRITLRVTDSTGLATEVTRDVRPVTANVTLATNVPGLQLTLDGQPAPATFVGVVGVQRQLGAPPSQTVNGTTYDFVSWSDGGAATHDITTPDAAATFTATYQPRVAGPAGADLTATVTSGLKDLVVGGERGRATVRVSNAGTEAVTGPVQVRLFLSADGTPDAGDAPLVDFTPNLRLRPGKSKSFAPRFDLPVVGDGNYVLLAEVDGGNTVAESNDSNNTAASVPTIYRAPVVDLSGTFVAPPTTAARGTRSSVTLGILNGGNVVAGGQMSVILYASTDGSGAAGVTPLATTTTSVRLKPGATRRMRIRFVSPADLAAGTYFFSAAIDSGGQIAESDEANNLAVATDPFNLT